MSSPVSSLEVGWATWFFVISRSGLLVLLAFSPLECFGFAEIFGILLSMSEGKLRALVKQIDTGGLSRNKNYELFRDPLVKEAKRRQVRLHALRRLLCNPNPPELALEKEDRQPPIWTLMIKMSRLDFSWKVRLLSFEMELLLEEPRVRRAFKGFLPFCESPDTNS